MPGWLVAWLLAINVATFAAYAWDKARSRRPGARRVRERTLWLLCVAGGVGGAWLAFFGLRHKARHRSFWIVQSAATILWVVVIVLVLTG